MKLFIPKLGTIIQLTKDWSFSLHRESRNQKLYMRACGLNVDDFSSYHKGIADGTYKHIIPVTLPEKSILKVDRIYIRSGQSNFDSVTFTLVDSPAREFVTNPKAKPRFWVKLDDVNKIEFEMFEG